MNIFITITAIIAYFIGAIPTGYIIAQLKGIADIRSHGSGNIGATNVSRFLGIHYFFLVFFLDAGKAFLFLYIIHPYFSTDFLYIFAALVLFGNGCSLFLQGSGGKGVATLTGLMSGLHPIATLILLCIWSSILLLTHTVGIASVTTIIFLPFYAYINNDLYFFVFSLFATLWIIRSHWTNIVKYWSHS